MSHEFSSDISEAAQENLSAQGLSVADEVKDGQVDQTEVPATGDDDAPPLNSQPSGKVDQAIQASTDKSEEPEPLAPVSPKIEPPEEDEEPLPPPLFTIQEVPHNIGDEDQLWKNANKLAKSLIDEQTQSMNGTLDTMLIFVS